MTVFLIRVRTQAKKNANDSQEHRDFSLLSSGWIGSRFDKVDSRIEVLMTRVTRSTSKSKLISSLVWTSRLWFLEVS